MQPCLPQVSFLPSCRALAEHSSFAAAALRAAFTRPPHHAVPSQLQQHIHQLRSSLPPGMPSNTETLLELLIFSPRPGHGSSCPAAADGADRARESSVPGCVPTRAKQQSSQLSPAGVLLPTTAWRGTAPQAPHACGGGLKHSWLKPRQQERGRGQSGGYLRGVPHLQREHGTK